VPINYLIPPIFSMLIFILPIPGTIALRNVLFVLLTLLLLIGFIRDKSYLRVSNLNTSLVIMTAIFFVFILYVFFHSIYISEVIEWSLNNLRRHLFYGFLYFIVGLLIANFAYKSESFPIRSLLTILFFSMFVHIFYIDMVALDKLWNANEILRRYGGLIEYITAANYITNILLAFCIAELVYRLRTREKILLVSDGVLYLLIGFSIVSSFIEGLRLGDIALVLLGVGSAVVFLYRNQDFSRRKRQLIAASLIVILSLPLAYNIAMDPRWAKLIETVPMAINSADSQHWVDHSQPMPKTESGYAVGGSNYERIFRAKKSIDFIYSEPLGIGYGGDSFGRAFKKIYPDYGKEVYHGRDSHSAILSLTIGVGIPGLFLWIFFIFYASKTSIINLKKNYDFFPILSIFILMGMFSRSFVDTNMRDHIIMQYMIIFGIVIFLTLKRNSIEKSN